jgi:thiosulfate sulfurtransferase
VVLQEFDRILPRPRAAPHTWGRCMPRTIFVVRRAGVRAEHGAQIAGAHWHDPAAWLDWKDGIDTRRPAGLYCAKGHEIGQGLSTTLRVLGADARYPVGGMQGWLAQGRPAAPLASEELAS